MADEFKLKPKETPHPAFDDETAPDAVRDVMTVERVLKIDYTNWRNERSIRTLIPWRFEFRATEHHPERQWMIIGYDLDRLQWRAYPIKDVHRIVEPDPPPVNVDEFKPEAA